MDTMKEHTIRCRDTHETFLCSEQQTILNAMEKRGKRGIGVGCRGGGCGVCKIKIISGAKRTKKMSRKRVTEQEESEGYVLACRTYPCSDIDYKYYGVEGLAEK